MHDAPDRAQVVKTFGKEAADFMEVAASLGWKCLFNNTGTSLTLVPAQNDAPSNRIHLSSRNKGGGLMKKYAKKLAKYADLDSLAVIEIAHDAGLPFDVVQALGRMALVEDEDAITVLPEEKPKERFVKPAAVTPAAVAEKVKKERHVISERPALMHYSLTQSKGGQSYPSKTTVERRWSDGAVDYICAIATCDAGPREDRRSFGGPHWAMHVRNGEAEAVDSDEARRSLVDDPTYTEPAWSRKSTLKQRRTAELQEMLSGVDLKKISPEDLAALIVDFLGDSGGGSNNGKPLTDEQVLDRIRSLVDRGTYAEQEAALLEAEKQIEAVTSYATQREEELLQKVLEAEQSAIKSKSHLDALRDLINEGAS